MFANPLALTTFPLELATSGAGFAEGAVVGVGAGGEGAAGFFGNVEGMIDRNGLGFGGSSASLGMPEGDGEGICTSLGGVGGGELEREAARFKAIGVAFGLCASALAVFAGASGLGRATSRSRVLDCIPQYELAIRSLDSRSSSARSFSARSAATSTRWNRRSSSNADIQPSLVVVLHPLVKTPRASKTASPGTLLPMKRKLRIPF